MYIDHSTLDTSFYVMADEARKRMLTRGKNSPPSTTPVENTQPPTNNTPIRKSNDSISIPDEKKMKQDLLEELKKLRKTVQILSQQNAILLSVSTTVMTLPPTYADTIDFKVYDDSCYARSHS